MKNISILILFIMITSACSEQTNSLSKVNRKDFQTVVDGKNTDLFVLKNKNGLEMTVTNYGARVVEFFAPDRSGNFEDIVLGHDNIDKYVNFTGERFLGATIGRFGNRIADGRFTLDGVDYQLTINDGPNSLHGGEKGFDRVVWDTKQINPQKLEFTYRSADGEQGYPGNLDVKMTYELTDDNEFKVTHRAVTDKKTVINLTHHSFFNLHGAGNGTINDHVLMLNADKFTPVDDVLIPTGEQLPVDGTPMDFRNPTPIGNRVNDDYQQLKYGRGYDHNWILNRKTPKGLELAATVYEPESGRFMEVYTTEPGIQFYGGNFFDGEVGKNNKRYEYRASLALETQHFPDSPNHLDFPSTVLSPGEEYEHICIYKVTVKD